YSFRAGRSLLDLRGVLFQLGGELFYLLLLLRDGCAQVLNFQIKHSLLGGVGNGSGLTAFGRKSTRSLGGERAQSSIGIDHHNSSRRGGNRCTGDVVDKAPVTFLAKNTVHTRVMTDDDIVIGGSDTRPCLSAYGNIITRGFVAHERLITDGGIVV